MLPRRDLPWIPHRQTNQSSHSGLIHYRPAWAFNQSSSHLEINRRDSFAGKKCKLDWLEGFNHRGSMGTVVPAQLHTSMALVGNEFCIVKMIAVTKTLGGPFI